MHTVYITGLFLSLLFSPSVLQHEVPPVPANEDFLFMSGDDGLTWQRFGQSWTTEIFPLSFWTDQNHYYLAALNGLYSGTSAMSDTKWQKEMMPDKEIMNICPGRDGAYAISRQNGVYHYQPAAGKWESVQGNLKDKSIYTFLETTNGALYAGGEGGLYKTTDHGTTWQRILEKGKVTKLLESHGSLLCISHSDVWQSTDQGATWNHTLISPTSVFQLTSIDDGLVAIAMGQEFLGESTANQTYLSKDDGLTWKPIAFTLPRGLEDIYDLRQSGSALIACSNDGLFRSADQGQTWKVVFQRQKDNNNIFKLTSSGGRLFALLVQGC